jgi:hypothetical protein
MSQFDDWSDVGLSFLQNMLGNSISMQGIIKKIEDAVAVHDERQELWWYGRIATLAIHFEPLDDEFDDFEDEYVAPSSKVIPQTPKLLQSQPVESLAEKLYKRMPKRRLAQINEP